MYHNKYRSLSKTIFSLLVGFLILYFLISINLKKVGSKKVVFSLDSNTLVSAYMENEKESDKKYTNKLIGVTGTVKNISFINNKSTVILHSNLLDSGVICEMDESESEKVKRLKQNQQLHVRGICKGYLKDVILLNCFIDNQKQHE